MKNIVTLTIGLRTPNTGEVDSLTEFELDEEYTIYVLDISATDTELDTIADLRYEITEGNNREGILDDLKHYFNPSTPVQRNWDNLEDGFTTQIHLLFEEHFDVTETENGPEGDYWSEYLGILLLGTLSEKNCFTFKEIK